MTGVDLLAEYRITVSAIHQHHLDHLLARGITGRAMLDVGMIGVAAIKTDREGLYQPAASGRPALILPAWDRPPVRPDGAMAWDAMPVDLVAVRTDDPGHWWTRRGVVTMLGDWQVDYAMLGDDPVHIHRDPLAWLRAGGVGLVVLADDGFDTLANLPGLTVDYAEHGRKIRSRLSRPPSVPRIFVAADRRAAA